MDGYAAEENYARTFQAVYELSERRFGLNSEMMEIAQELNGIHHIPTDMNRWIESLATNEDRFKLQDLEKLHQLSRRYHALIDRQQDNDRRIRILAIENLIGRIEALTGR